MPKAAFSPAALLSARRRAGLSQEQLAVAVGVFDQTRISLWERGLEQPRTAVIPRLATALGVPATDLLDAGAAGPDLAMLRMAAGMTVAEFASQTGLDRMRYWRIENGRRPSTDEVAVIAAALGITVPALQRALPRPTPRDSQSGN